MLLLELFNQPAPSKMVKSDQDEVVFRASLSDGTALNLTFSQIRQGQWKFAFTRHTPERGVMNRIRSAVGIDPKLSAGSYGKTGQGNQGEVFATVVAVIKQFYGEYNPFQLVFTADKGDTGMDDSRASLYASMVLRMFPSSRYDVKIDDAMSFDQFTITRKDQNAAQ
jgi:hypothetical protein